MRTFAADNQNEHTLHNESNEQFLLVALLETQIVAGYVAVCCQQKDKQEARR